MTQPLFSPRLIEYTVAAQLLALSAVGYFALSGHESAFTWAIPILLVIAALGMKLAAPRIPRGEIAAGIAIVLVANIATDWLIRFSGIPILTYVGDLLVALICVYCFGSRWVRMGHIPLSANKWP